MNIEIRFPKNETQLYSICIGRGDPSGKGRFTFSQVDLLSVVLEDHDNPERPEEVTYARMLFSLRGFKQRVSRKTLLKVDTLIARLKGNRQ